MQANIAAVVKSGKRKNSNEEVLSVEFYIKEIYERIFNSLILVNKVTKGKVLVFGQLFPYQILDRRV